MMTAFCSACGKTMTEARFQTHDCVKKSMALSQAQRLMALVKSGGCSVAYAIGLLKKDKSPDAKVALAKLQTAKAPAAKIATCISAVPAVLSPTGAAIKKGTKISYIKTTFRNGEGHLILAGKKSVPDVFFEL